MAQEYRCVAQNVPGFVAQLVRYVASGHYFYVRVLLPEHKDATAIDAKLLARYDADRKRWQRKRRRLKQNAGVHYIRCRRVAVLMVTKGRHETFYADHGSNISDIRRTALKVYGYSIRFNTNANKVSVRLDEQTQSKAKAHLETIAAWDSYRDVAKLEREFMRLPYQPYAPVYRQLITIAKSVNRIRRKRGFDPIDLSCVRTKKRLVKVFMEEELAEGSGTEAIAWFNLPT